MKSNYKKAAATASAEWPDQARHFQRALLRDRVNRRNLLNFPLPSQFARDIFIHAEIENSILL